MDPVPQKRVEELVPKYERMLAPFVQGKEEEFRTWCRGEAARLVQVQFGEPIVHTLGYLYTRKGEAEAGKSKLLGIPTVVEKIREVCIVLLFIITDIAMVGTPIRTRCRNLYTTGGAWRQGQACCHWGAGGHHDHPARRAAAARRGHATGAGSGGHAEQGGHLYR